MKPIFIILAAVIAASCVSTKSTIKNVDDNAPIPKVVGKAFVITEFATDKRYGYDPDYPINIFYSSTRDENINQERFFNALAGPDGEKIFFTKMENCCPFPTKRTDMGAGFLDVYEVRWLGQKKPVTLYLNIYEKGRLMVPVGFTLKNTK